MYFLKLEFQMLNYQRRLVMHVLFHCLKSINTIQLSYINNTKQFLKLF